jgi:transposase
MVEVPMSSKRYTQEFKDEALKQISDRGHSIADVSDRLGVSIHSLYAWQKRSGKPVAVRQVESDQASELHRLKADLRRVTEERDILKKAAAYFAKQSG